MKRRDFLKTSVVAGVALSLNFEGLQAGGVAVVGLHIGQHRVDGRAAHFGGGRVICIDLHGVPPRIFYHSCRLLPTCFVG